MAAAAAAAAIPAKSGAAVSVLVELGLVEREGVTDGVPEREGVTEGVKLGVGEGVLDKLAPVDLVVEGVGVFDGLGVLEGVGDGVGAGRGASEIPRNWAFPGAVRSGWPPKLYDWDVMLNEYTPDAVVTRTVALSGAMTASRTALLVDWYRKERAHVVAPDLVRR